MIINKKECVAMLLAGGQGSRLYALTNKIAKPAVTYGGKYRIIDFPLSNCVNSGIDTVGVLTQYQPLILNEYIGNGEPWDLDRSYGGVHILSPYQAKTGSEWFKGTANAIYQNISFIKRYEHEADEKSSKDFGKDVLPKMLAAGEKMVSYTFEGYWKDVGTINSLFESNMDLLGNSPEFDLADPTWRIRSRNPVAPPQYIGETGRVVNSIVASGCEIEGTVENCILSHDVVIKKGAVIRNSVIYSQSVIEEKVTIGNGAKVGGSPEKGKSPVITVLGRDITVSDGAKIAAGEIVDKNV